MTEKKHTAEIVGDILAMYASMMNGQIISSESAEPPDKVAAVLCAAEVMKRAHAKALLAIAPTMSPAWVLGEDKLESTAQTLAERMVGK